MPSASHLQTAISFEKSGDFAKAIQYYTVAWQESPNDIQRFRALEKLLLKVRATNQLKSAYELAAQVFADDIQITSNYANLLNSIGEHEMALTQCNRMLSRVPENVPLLVNRANAHRFLGQVDEAISDYEKALEIEPKKYPLASFNLGCLYLLKEDYNRGFPLYEARLGMTGYERLKSRNGAPFWEKQNLTGKTILVYAEQGLGDTLMFSRFLQPLIEEAERVYLECQKPLAWMFEQWAGLEVIPRKTPDKPCSTQTDYQIPLLSLAGIFGDLKSEIPIDNWQSIRTQTSTRVNTTMGILTGPKVGLAWQGNAKAAVDLGRSMDFQFLKPLESVEVIERISLQAKEGVPADFDNTQWLIWKDLDDGLNAFEETIQILNQLDLVICTDSAIAHLAGTLGKEVWLLLQYTAEWRWGLDSKESPWYPKMTFYRQTTKGDWGSVIQQVKSDLIEKFNN